MSRQRLLSVALAGGAMGLVGEANAQPAGGSEESEASAPSAEDASLPASPSRLSLDLKLRYESDYFFRGIVQRSDAFNLQPSATLTVDVLRDQPVTLSLFGGTWNNISDDLAPGGSGDFGEHWYEADLFLGASLGWERWTLAGTYTWYHSPASDWDEYEDITFTLGFGDGGLWDEQEKFSINPWVSLAVETDHAADGIDSGVWLGLGVTPTYGVGETALGDLTLSAPIGVGLSLDDYYQRADGSDDTFGSFEAGVVAALGLSGQWGWAAPTLEVGAKYLYLGNTTEEYNSDDQDELVVSVGLGWSF